MKLVIVESPTKARTISRFLGRDFKVESSCISNTQTCDYEKNLWAALALYRTGNNINSLLPYLTSFSEDNSNKFPSAFLYRISSTGENYLQDILNLRNTGSSWNLGEKGEYYDTALGLLALSGSDDSSSTLSWLEEKQKTNPFLNN